MELKCITVTRIVLQLILYLALTRICIAQVKGAIPTATSLSTEAPPMPVFLQNPQDGYLIKNQDTVFACTAQPARIVHFRCGNTWLDPQHQAQLQTFDFYDEFLINSTFTVNKKNLDVGKNGTVCECVAWNGASGPVVSAKARVKVAYLEKFFINEPLGKVYDADQAIELYCSPPPGEPEPEVIWVKDGTEIDLNDPHYFINNVNSLVISQPTTADNGNYTCIARNAAAERFSIPALVKVAVYGEWSEWSSWSSCDPLCGVGVQTRRRKCSQPASDTEGLGCKGPMRDTRGCQNICPLNGGWGQWSEWKTCNAQCQSIRTRSCDNPEPINGGRDCVGDKLEKTNCTGDLCSVLIFHKNGGYYDNTNHVVHGSSGLADHLPVYIGIALAFFIILMASIFMVVCFMSRRKREIPMYSVQTTAVDDCTSAMLTVQPDITQTGHPAFCTHVNLPREFDKPNGLHHSNSYLETTKSNSPHHMSVSFSPKNGTITHLGGYSSSHSDGSHYSLQNGSMKSQVHTYVPLVGPGQERHYCTASKDRPCCYDRCHGHDEDSDFYSQHKDEPVYALPIQSSESSMGPESEVDTDHLPFQEPGIPRTDTPMMASGRFGPRGGRLIIPEAGVSLFIPDGAITRNNGEEVYIAIDPDPTNQPNISPNCTSLSPVVVAGPPGLAFSKPVILTIPHCSQRRDGDWRYSIYSCNMSVQPQGIWERLVTAGEETINTLVYCQVDSSSCSVILDQLGSFVLMGESTPPRTAGKRLRLATFGPALRFNMDYSIKVYVTDDTPDAIERVVQLEQKFGGVLLHRPKLMEFQDDSGNLRLSLDQVMQGWQCKLSANFQEIPFFHVWSGTYNTLHCSFTLAREDPSLDVVGCRVHVTQGFAQTSLQVLEITRRMEDGMEHQSYHTSPSQSSVASFETPTKVFRLPRPVRARLCTSLDPPRPAGNDWRLLAAKLGVDGYINFFATKPSPTDQILDLWEARCREDSAVSTLIHLLREMGRNDAVAVLEQVPWM